MKRLARTLMTAAALYATTTATAQTWSWATESSGTGIEYGNSVATDASGNNYVGGSYINNPAVFGTYTLTALGNGDGYVAKYNSAGTVQWAVKLAGTLYDYVKDVAVDGSDVFVSGTYRGTMILYSTTATTISLTGGPSADNIYIAKYNSSGVVQWAITVSGSSDSWDLALSPSQQKVFISGEKSGELFAACYSYSTAPVSPIWTLSCTTAGTGSHAMGIAADNSGNAYVLGSYFGPATGTLSTGNTFTGNYGMLLMKVAPTGTLTWVTNIGNGTSGMEDGRGVELDAAGNIYIGGQYTGTANISGITFASAGNFDVFVAKYSNAGVVQWAKRMGGPGTTGGDWLNGFAVSPAGDSYLFTVNNDNNNVPFGCKSYPAIFGNNDNKMIIAKFNTQGLHKGSAAPFLDNTSSYPGSVSLDGSGNAILTGHKIGAFSAGSFTLTTGANMFLTKVTIADELPVVASTDVHLCGLGSSTTLSASGPVGSTIKWYDAAMTLVATSTTYNTPAAVAYSAVVYYVSSTVGACESARVPITVTTHTINTLLASADQTVCAGTCATITFTNATTAIRNPGALTVSSPFTVCPSSTTTYTLTNTAVNYCEVPDMVKITVIIPSPFLGTYSASINNPGSCTPPVTSSKPICTTPTITATMPTSTVLPTFRCEIANALGWEGAGFAGINALSFTATYTVDVYEADLTGNRISGAPSVFLISGTGPSSGNILFNASGNGAGFDASNPPFFVDAAAPADPAGITGTGDYFKLYYYEAYAGGASALAAYSAKIFCVDLQQTTIEGCSVSKKSYFRIANNGKTTGAGARMGTAGDAEEEGEEDYKSLEIFPNPTNSIAYITLNSNDKNVQITITDNLGKQVMKNNHLELSHGQVNMESLPAGIYFYTILKNNVSYKGKIVKQ
jgi:hypothetical protein